MMRYDHPPCTLQVIVMCAEQHVRRQSIAAQQQPKPAVSPTSAAALARRRASVFLWDDRIGSELLGWGPPPDG